MKGKSDLLACYKNCAGVGQQVIWTCAWSFMNDWHVYNLNLTILKPLVAKNIQFLDVFKIHVHIQSDICF